jgi:hypothetical protein
VQSQGSADRHGADKLYSLVRSVLRCRRAAALLLRAESSVPQSIIRTPGLHLFPFCVNRSVSRWRSSLCFAARE